MIFNTSSPNIDLVSDLVQSIMEQVNKQLGAIAAGGKNMKWTAEEPLVFMIDYESRRTVLSKLNTIIARVAKLTNYAVDPILPVKKAALPCAQSAGALVQTACGGFEAEGIDVDFVVTFVQFEGSDFGTVSVDVVFEDLH